MNVPIPLEALPALNALLNSAVSVLLVVGWAAIRRKEVAAHRACMLGAVALSAAFLASYLHYHFHHGATPYPRRDWTRPVYFAVLGTHTALAIVTLPMILATLARALRGEIDRHRRIARWTLPLWLYVAVTGPVVYWMLHRMG